MDKELSFRLLRIAYSGLKTLSNHTAEAMGRDIYDLVYLHTIHGDLRYQMSECRLKEWDRITSLRYLNHRFNIGLV